MSDQRRPNAEVHTSLVHRPARTASPWWHSCAVINAPMRPSEPDDACLLGEIAKDQGFDAYMLHPDSDELLDSTSLLAPVCARLKETGLKVIIRLPGSTPRRSLVPSDDEGLERLLAGARRAVECGADGVDLDDCGADTTDRLSVETGHAEQERFSALIRLLQAELAVEDPEPILSFGVMAHEAAEIRTHLEEEWFHHLRDDSLSGSEWRAESLLGRAVDALAVRDPLGAVMTWSAHAGDPTSPVESRDPAQLALVLFALSLPGAVYLEVDLAGLKHADASTARTIVVSEPVTRALRLRAEYGLGTGSLGVISGLKWAKEGVSIHVNGPMLIVLNTGDEEFAVPEAASLLVASRPVSTTEEGTSRVPGATCAWFKTPRVRPTTADYWD